MSYTEQEIDKIVSTEFTDSEKFLLNWGNTPTADIRLRDAIKRLYIEFEAHYKDGDLAIKETTKIVNHYTGYIDDLENYIKNF
jgi:hypothetical protein